MDKFKILVALSLIITTSLATVTVTEPKSKSLEPGETLDLTENPYEAGYELKIKIEKENWEEVEAEGIETKVEGINDEYLQVVFEIPEEEEENTINVSFISPDEEQSNLIKYRARDVSLEAHMNYPLKRELPEDERVNIGDIAPGQEVNLLFSRRSLFYENSPPFYWEGIRMDGKESDYYNVPKEKPLKEILPPEIIEGKDLGDETYLSLNLDAPEETGEYNFNITLNSPFSSSEERKISMTVKEDLYDLEIPSEVEIQAGKYRQIPVTIKSHSIAIENFTSTPKSLPDEWMTGSTGKKSFDVKVRPEEMKEFNLPVKINQEGRYNALYEFKDSRSIWRRERSVTITSTPTTGSKLHGFKKGHSLTLPILQPFYSILSLFG